MRLYFLGFLLPLVVAGCVTTPTTQAAPAVENPETRSDPERAVRGLAFSQMHCVDCHGVTAGQVSANDKAPPFEAIANARGLTEGTLQAWLRDSHNYPGQMDFEIDAKRIDELAAHMLTLRSSKYRPPVQ
jgi:mono/diheme cytochrome c family protein